MAAPNLLPQVPARHQNRIPQFGRTSYGVNMQKLIDERAARQKDVIIAPRPKLLHQKPHRLSRRPSHQPSRHQPPRATKTGSKNTQATFDASSTPKEDNTKPQDPGFTLFPKLPPEIRRMIWIYAAPKSCLLSPSTTLTHLPLEKEFADSQAQKFKAAIQGIPAVLHVCQESRNEFFYNESRSLIRKKHVMFSLCTPAHLARQKHEYKPWFLNVFASQIDRDTVFLTEPAHFKISDVLLMTRHLALNTTSFRTIDLFFTLLTKFECLRSITFVISAKAKIMAEVDGEVDRKALEQDSVYHWWQFNGHREAMEAYRKVYRKEELVVRIRTLEQFLEDFI